MPQIPNALIPCYVVQLNNTIFIQGDQVVGRVLDVPCKNDFIDDPNYWAVPIKDGGIFTTLEYILVALSPAQPTYDSFPVFRVRDKLSGYFWMIYGNHDNFVSSCSTCCDDATIPMPHTTDGFIINIAPCDTIGDVNNFAQNTAGKYYSTTALPVLQGTETYYPYGSYNNVAFPSAAAHGYANPTLLLAYLNATWTNVGSPNVTIVWTLSADNLTLFATFTGSLIGDTFCIVVSNILSSL
jgi:hypothetical protein